LERNLDIEAYEVVVLLGISEMGRQIGFFVIRISLHHAGALKGIIG
jgi:hypothetical protein